MRVAAGDHGALGEAVAQLLTSSTSEDFELDDGAAAETQRLARRHGPWCRKRPKYQATL
jgi:hypothetical protein